MKFLLPLLFLFAASCAAKPRMSVTSGLSGSVQRAGGAVSESVRASERSSARIKAFRTNAERIDYKAGRALQLL